MSIFTSTYTRLSVCLLFVILVILYIIHYYSWPSWNYSSLQSKNFGKYGAISPNIRILCFGDSLTAGVKGGDVDPSPYHPYSKTLKKLFDKELSTKRQSKLSVRIRTKGVPGERVLGGMKPRLYGLMNSNVTYDWVIILGGTNDLKFLFKKPDIAPNVTAVLEALLELHDLSHAFLARTIAVSIPPRQCERTSQCKSNTEARHFVNKQLRLYSTKRKGKTFYVDIEKEMSTDMLQYWSDEVHFTELGYDRIAGIIFDTLYNNI